MAQQSPVVAPDSSGPAPTGASVELAAPNPWWNCTLPDAQNLLYDLAQAGYPGATIVGVNPLSTVAGQVINGPITPAEFSKYGITNTTELLLLVNVPGGSQPQNAAGPILKMRLLGYSWAICLG